MADHDITSYEFLTQEFEFEYCEECHGDQQDHRALWDSHCPPSGHHWQEFDCSPLEHHWLVACSAEQDWERGNRWGHPCRIDDCTNHSPVL
jgi:hypothetical protein